MNTDLPLVADDRLKVLARLAPLLFAAQILVWGLHLRFGSGLPRDGTSLVVGRDFLNFWMAGRAAWLPHPERFYDFVAYQAEMAKVTGPGYPGQVWSYPPSIMLLAAPFGRLPYLPALIAWTVMGPLVLFLAIRRLTADWDMRVAILLCPAAVLGFLSGQFAFLAAALILTVLRCRDARPWLPGCCSASCH